MACFIKYPVKVVRESRYNSKRPVTVDTATRIVCLPCRGAPHNLTRSIALWRDTLCWVMPGLRVSTRCGPKSDLQRGRPSVYILWRRDLRPITLRTPARCERGQDQARHLVPWTQTVIRSPRRAPTMLNCDIWITNPGTDDVESPYYIPAWQLVRIGTKPSQIT